MSERANKQYTKIQDFVVYNMLFRGKPKDMSHADIIIELAKKQIKAEQKDSADFPFNQRSRTETLHQLSFGKRVGWNPTGA